MHMTSTREQEWQFAAEGLDTTRAWIARQPIAYSERRFSQCDAVDLRDTYFDSADWQIFRAGFALRLRHKREESGSEGSELTLKSLAPTRSGFADRIEISEPLAAPDLSALAQDSGIGAKLRELLGDRALVPLFQANTRRERQLLLEADSDLPLAELDLDHTSIESPAGQSRHILRVEIECLNAEPAALAPLMEELRDAGQLIPAAQSKFQTGLEVAGLADSLPRPLPRREISATQPFSESQLAILGKYFESMLAKEAAARAGSPEAVHEMRVASRHLETLLKTFVKHGPLWAVRSRGAIRALVKALGGVRDCDVQIAWLDDAAKHGDLAGRDVLAATRARIEKERVESRQVFAHLLDSEAQRGWIDRWRRELENTNVSHRRSEATALVAQTLIRAQARKLRRRADRLERHSSPEDYHEVRIRAKRLRYVVDAFSGLYGRAAKDYAQALAKLQDVLGEYHDASVRAARFTKLATSEGELPAAMSFALGRLVQSDSAAIDKCRQQFPKAYRRVRRRRWQALEAAMDASAAKAG
jgi:CHAD domain-containing protein